MTTGPYELVVLDLAGTTVVDDGIVEEAFARAWDRVRNTDDGRAAAIAHVRATMGQSKIAVFRAIVDEDTAQELNRVFEDTYRELIDEGRSEAIPGAEDAIRALRERGLQDRVTTGFSAATAEAILRSLDWTSLADVVLTPARLVAAVPPPTSTSWRSSAPRPARSARWSSSATPSRMRPAAEPSAAPGSLSGCSRAPATSRRSPPPARTSYSRASPGPAGGTALTLSAVGRARVHVAGRHGGGRLRGEERGFERIAVPELELQPGEALVEVELATICGSDVHTWRGSRPAPTPLVLGHEQVGRIAALGSGRKVRTVDGHELAVGDRVVWGVAVRLRPVPLLPGRTPQKCVSLAKYGHERMRRGWELSGGFATHVHLRPHTAMVKVGPEAACGGARARVVRDGHRDGGARRRIRHPPARRRHGARVGLRDAGADRRRRRARRARPWSRSIPLPSGARSRSSFGAATVADGTEDGLHRAAQARRTRRGLHDRAGAPGAPAAVPLAPGRRRTSAPCSCSSAACSPPAPCRSTPKRWCAGC